MGLSASQARLLSITARLTDNEYHSQQITNAKMRLASASNDARTDYQKALNGTMLVYNGFDTEGNATSTIFTPNVIYQYQPLKNQYSLINTSNQILVTHNDAKNYEDTDNIIDFLDKYDVLDNYREDYGDYQNRYNQYLYELALYEDDMEKWNINNDKYKEYLRLHKEWENAQQDSNLYNTFAEKIGTSNHPIAYCYSEALEENAGCYLHLLNMMLDYDGTSSLTHHTYKATCDKNGNFNTSFCNVTTNASKGGMFISANFETMKFVSDALNEQREGQYLRYCDGDDDFKPDYLNGGNNDTNKYNLLQSIIDSGGKPTAVDILRSDYIYDPESNTATNKKTLKQKAIDLYYLIANNMISGETLKETLINFTEGDMKGISTPEPEKVPEPGEVPTKPKEPIPPTVKIKDKEKAQWYVNLWSRMNGSIEAPRIQTKEGTDELDEYYRMYLLEDVKYIKDTFDKHYDEIDMNLASSTTWLHDVLTQGIVVMQRVDTNKIDGEHKLDWNYIVYSDASEITEEQDEQAVAKAEIRYEKTMKDIQKKDKRFQLEINKLDSEHNALQNEIDSIRSQVSKNVERSFKTFS